MSLLLLSGPPITSVVVATASRGFTLSGVAPGRRGLGRHRRPRPDGHLAGRGGPRRDRRLHPDEGHLGRRDGPGRDRRVHALGRLAGRSGPGRLGGAGSRSQARPVSRRWPSPPPRSGFTLSGVATVGVGSAGSGGFTLSGYSPVGVSRDGSGGFTLAGVSPGRLGPRSWSARAGLTPLRASRSSAWARSLSGGLVLTGSAARSALPVGTGGFTLGRLAGRSGPGRLGRVHALGLGQSVVGGHRHRLEGGFTPLGHLPDGSRWSRPTVRAASS